MRSFNTEALSSALSRRKMWHEAGYDVTLRFEPYWEQQGPASCLKRRRFGEFCCENDPLLATD
jgi:hypothetical protein